MAYVVMLALSDLYDTWLNIEDLALGFNILNFFDTSLLLIYFHIDDWHALGLFYACGFNPKDKNSTLTLLCQVLDSCLVRPFLP